MAPNDSRELTGVNLQLSNALEKNPDETCAVYRISPDFPRSRTVNNNGRILALFQGAAPVSPKRLRGTVYPGDTYIRDDNNVTIQIHMLELKQNEEPVAQNVPVVTIWVPERMSLDWITQHQPLE